MASQGKFIDVVGLKAGAALTAKQWHAVKLATTAGEVVACSAVTDRPIGILQNDPADGEPAFIGGLGNLMTIAATSTISAGDALAWNSTGAVTYTTAIFARAVKAPAAAGDLIPIVFHGA